MSCFPPPFSCSLSFMMRVSIFSQQIPVSFDEFSTGSWIPHALAISFNCYNNYICLPVNADIGQGSFTCAVDLIVTDELSDGVILGKDWFAYHQECFIFEGQSSENRADDRHSQSDVILDVFAYLPC
jgi:hypothetical protein